MNTVALRSATRLRLVVGAVLTALGALSIVGSPSASAQTAPPGFTAANSAHGARIQLTLSQFPLFKDVIDAGGPTAQTNLDTAGSAGALAAFPYPGDVLLGLPGLAAGLGPQVPSLVNSLPSTITGAIPGLPPELVDLLNQVQIPEDTLAPLVEQAPPLPAYPFVAQADSFDNEDSVDLGFGTLEARAGPRLATALAESRPGASGALLAPITSTARIEVLEDGSVLNEAQSVVRGLQFGPVALGSIRSLARMTLDPDGETTQESEFSISGVSIAGISVDITGDGFEIAGNPVPAPIADTLNQALAAVGLTITVLPEERTETGVIAAGLQISRDVELNTELPGIGNLGEGTFSVIFGQSSVRLNAGVAASPFPTPSVPPPPPPPAGPDAGTDAGSFVTPPPPVSAGTVDAGPPDTPAPTVAAPQSGQPPTDIPAVATQALPEPPFDVGGIYLLLVGLGVLVSGSGQLLRVSAFRPR